MADKETPSEIRIEKVQSQKSGSMGLEEFIANTPEMSTKYGFYLPPHFKEWVRRHDAISLGQRKTGPEWVELYERYAKSE
jgi:hypothetical protein